MRERKLRPCRILYGRGFVIFGVASQISTHFCYCKSFISLFNQNRVKSRNHLVIFRLYLFNKLKSLI
jgi:hypothetical protein